MGNRVPEVQSKIAMRIIGFVDDLRKHLDVEEKRLFSSLLRFANRPRPGRNGAEKSLLHCDGASRRPPVRPEIC
jgi:hypothetical protein